MARKPRPDPSLKQMYKEMGIPIADDDPAIQRPTLRSYVSLRNLVTFGAFWVVLAAILRLAFG